MKKLVLFASALTVYLVAISFAPLSLKKEDPMKKKLKHIVLIEFKTSTAEQDIEQIKNEALTLQQIRGVNNLHFSRNVSPEKLNKHYTHALTMWFESEEDRDKIYLPHPIHQKFVDLFVPQTNNVLVFDYWE